MFKNYLTIALRTLRKQKLYSAINVFGLAVGLASVLLMALFAGDEFAFDRFHDKADRIVRITSHFNDETGMASFARSDPAIGPTLERDFAEVELTARFQRFNGVLRHDDRLFNEDAMFFAEGSVFDLFTWPLVQGDPASALIEPYTAVLTETTARRYFGEDDPMDQTLVLNDTLVFRVTGVAQDVPIESHLRFDVLLSFETWKALQAARGRDLDNLWTNGTYYTYALLQSPEAITSVEARLSAYVIRHLGEEGAAGYSLALQPLTDIHLDSGLRQELGPTGSRSSVYLFAAIAAFILLISCINFINLATARSAQRAREVGVRKTMGAQRGQLARQFLSEAVLLSLLGLVVAGILVGLTLPWFNAVTGKAITLSWAKHWLYVPASLGLAVGVGMLAGSYPAAVLSAFQPARVLKGVVNIRRGKTAVSLRRGLVVFQFALSIAIIACTLIVQNQLRYMRSQSLGFDQEQILVLPFNWDSAVLDRYETLKASLLEHAAVEQVTASGDVPGRMFTSLSYWIEGMPEEESRGIDALIVDPNFAETYGLKVVAGRDFSPDQVAGLGESFVLNEAAVAAMGFTPEEVLSKQFRMNTTGPVIGVVEDFHVEGLQSSVKPLVLAVWPDWFGYISVRLRTADAAQALADVEQAWDSVVPNRPFAYFFLDEEFDLQYQAEERFGNVFMAFASLAILISCLGLFGLASFTIELRTKEIGVRKVLGASVLGLVRLLSREFFVLVLIGFAAAVPIAFLFMRRWLDGFAYRTDLSMGPFLLAGVIALTIALMTVSMHAVRAATKDPVTALRYE